jgi:hypothetical protein
MKKLLVISAVMSLAVLFLVPGCSEDSTAPPAGFAVSSATASVAPNGDVVVTVSGGTSPYSITAGTDTAVATASISGGSLTIHGVDGGFTTVKVSDAASASATIPISVTGPITDDLFPLVTGHNFTFAGHAIATSGATLPDPTNRYQTVWTVGPAGPLPGSTVIVDSTRLIHPTLGEILVARNLLIVKNNITGEFFFAQTLGPFFRAFDINRTDTVRVVSIAKPELGIGGTWTAFDSTYVDNLGSNVRLQIFGEVEGGEVITDSSAAHDRYETVRFRTWRRISVDNAVIVDNATTSRLWLRRNLGPVQVLIAQDTENLGHFRTLKDKNF